MSKYDRCLQSAEAGEAEAQFQIGNCYYSGNGVNQDDAKALHWWLKASEQGHAGARAALGLDFCDNMEEDEMAQRTFEFEFLKSGAEKGEAKCQLGLGNAYLNGLGVKQDVNAAAEWWLKAAAQGVAQVEVENPAHKELASKKFAEFWVSSSVGGGKEQFMLGLLYFKGEFVEKSMDLAVYWWKRSAKQGFADALYNLGICSRDGTGLEQSDEQAIEYWSAAAELGHGDACYNLGLFYDAGKGVAKDREKAVEWWSKAESLGAGDSERFDVAGEYSDNLKVEAQKIKEKAEQGDEAAQFLLGNFHMDGSGVKKDIMMTAHWWHKAAEQGHVVAQHNMGSLYAEDHLGEPDMVKACYWWEKAAEQGLAQAQFRLGGCYGLGDGVDEDPEKMKYWWLKAAKQGHAKAIQGVKDLKLE